VLPLQFTCALQRKPQKVRRSFHRLYPFAITGNPRRSLSDIRLGTPLQSHFQPTFVCPLSANEDSLLRQMCCHIRRLTFSFIVFDLLNYCEYIRNAFHCQVFIYVLYLNTWVVFVTLNVAQKLHDEEWLYQTTVKDLLEKTGDIGCLCNYLFIPENFNDSH
jgi:hypothetical protein